MTALPLATDPEEDETPPDWREHPQPEVLERFMRSELSPDENSAVVRHLLTGCPPCCYITSRLWKLGTANQISAEALLQKRLRLLGQQGPAKPTRREAAMAALVKAAQEMLLEISKDLQAIYVRLEGMAAALPPWPQGDTEADDVVRELRAIINSVLTECLRSAIDDLRSAAYFPDEPPEKKEEPAP